MRIQLHVLTIGCTILLNGCGSADSARAKSDSSSAKDNSTEIAHDLTTPEGAILSLEDAYRAQDIEAAVRCKDFQIEATLMLQKIDQELLDDKEILAKTAEVLELGFRSEMKTNGFPDFRDVDVRFEGKKSWQGREDVVEFDEVCTHADGGSSKNHLWAAKTADGWKVVMIPDDE